MCGSEWGCKYQPPPAPPGELINSPDCKVSGYLIKWTNKWRLPRLSWVTNREIRPEIWLRPDWIWAVRKQLYSTSWNDCHSARQAVAAVARKLRSVAAAANNTRTAFQLSDFRFRFRVCWPGQARPGRAGSWRRHPKLLKLLWQLRITVQPWDTTITLSLRRETCLTGFLSPDHPISAGISTLTDCRTFCFKEFSSGLSPR